MRCVVCSETATVLDTEYDEGYCEQHADEYQVLGGPYVRIDKDGNDEGSDE